jgi:hypothetical protein
MVDMPSRLVEILCSLARSPVGHGIGNAHTNGRGLAKGMRRLPQESS